MNWPLLLIAAGLITTAGLFGSVGWRRRGRPGPVQFRADLAEEATIERYELLKRGFTLRWQAATRLTDRFLVGSAATVAMVTIWTIYSSSVGSGVAQVIIGPMSGIATTVAQVRPTQASPSPPVANRPAPGGLANPTPRYPDSRPIQDLHKAASGPRVNHPSPSSTPSPSPSPSPSPAASPPPSPANGTSSTSATPGPQSLPPPTLPQWDGISSRG